MHILLDVEKTLDKDTRQNWWNLVREMKANGHDVSIASGGYCNGLDLRLCGFNEEDFVHVFEKAKKHEPEYYATVFAPTLGVVPSDMVLIDDNMQNITTAIAAGAKESLQFTGVDDVRKALTERNILKPV